MSFAFNNPSGPPKFTAQGQAPGQPQPQPPGVGASAFGVPSQVNKPAFSFGTPGSTAATPAFGATSGGSFSFGNTATTTATVSPFATPPSGGFGFGPTTTTTASSGFSFGGAATSPPGFGGAATSPPGFGGAATSPPGFGGAATSPPGFGGAATSPPGFGGAATSPPGFGGAATSPPGFGGAASSPPGFGGAASSPPGFGGAATSPPGLGFKSPTTQAPAFAPTQSLAGPGFSFTGAKPATSTPSGSTIAWGTPSSGTGFGQPANAAPSFSLGQTPVAPATTISTGFGFASPPAQPTSLPFGAPATTTSSFGFGPTQPAAQPVSAVPTPAFGTTATLPSFGGSPATQQTGFGTATSAFGVPSSTSIPQPVSAFSAPATTAPPAFGTTVPALGQTSVQQPTASSGFSFGPKTTTASAPASTLSFNLAQTTSAAAPNPALSFGIAPSAGFGQTPGIPATPRFGVSQPAASIPPTQATPAASAPMFAPKPTGGFSLTPTTAPVATSNVLPIATTIAAPAPLITPASTQATTFQSSFTGFQIPGATSTTAVTSVSTTPASTASSLLLPLSTATSQPATTASLLAPSSGTGVSSAITPAVSTTITGFTGFQLPTATTALSSVPVPTTTTTSTTVSQPTPITSMNFGQLEESINKWSLELEEQEKVFINQATQVNAWDKVLIANGDKIVALNEMLQNVRTEQQSLDHEMDFIISQQRELEELLVPLEKDLGNVTITDPEREHTYQLADNVDTQLKQMSEDLKEIIEHLNESNRNEDNNDPIVQIGKILNAHISSMQWIDSATAQISNKLEQLSAMHNTLRRDNERSFHLTYN